MFTTKPPAPRIIRDLQESSTNSVVPTLIDPSQCNVSTFFQQFGQNQFEWYVECNRRNEYLLPTYLIIHYYVNGNSRALKH